MKVISGGQNGVEQIALKTAWKYKNRGFETGGTAPINFMTSEGPNTQLRSVYGLTELATTLPLNAQYVLRSRMNVDNADATLAFMLYASVGTAKTINYCKTHKWGPKANFKGYPQSYCIVDGPDHRPCMVVLKTGDMYSSEQIEAFKMFIETNKVSTLNVCGHRESRMFDAEKANLVHTLDLFFQNI